MCVCVCVCVLRKVWKRTLKVVPFPPTKKRALIFIYKQLNHRISTAFNLIDFSDRTS